MLCPELLTYVTLPAGHGARRDGSAQAPAPCQSSGVRPGLATSTESHCRGRCKHSPSTVRPLLGSSEMFGQPPAERFRSPSDFPGRATTSPDSSGRTPGTFEDNDRAGMTASVHPGARVPSEPYAQLGRDWYSSGRNTALAFSPAHRASLAEAQSCRGLALHPAISRTETACCASNLDH